MPNLLIKNVVIVSGGKVDDKSSDVLMSGDRISAIGQLPHKLAPEVIDGQGAYLAPGFIDVNTDSDHYLTLFSNPLQEDFLRQGVTTIVGGQCGASLAPLLYGGLESIQKWVDIGGATINWHTVKEFLDILERRKLGVNFATLLGHSTIRRALIGESIRPLTNNELKVFTHTLDRAMKEGAFGFSTGLAYLHSVKTPPTEIEFLAERIQKYGGVYTTHLRKGGKDLLVAVNEAITVARRTGIKTNISHFLPIKGFEEIYEKALQKIEALSPDVDLRFDISPFDVSVTPLYMFLPSWAQNGGLEVMNMNLADEWLRKKIMQELPEIEPRDLVVSRAVQNDALVGRSLHELADFYGTKDCKETLLRLMLTTHLKASVFYRNVDLSLVYKALRSRRSFVASNAASLPENKKIKKLERATATFPAFLSWVEDKKVISLGDAVKKITEEPATFFGFRERGLIKEKWIADLTLFRGGEIKATIVGGRLAYQDGKFSGTRSGKVFRHQYNTLHA